MSTATPSTHVSLLDCTLRDGGYYNDWDFSRELILRYVAAMKAARIPFVEIGFRTVDADTFLGPAAHSTDAYLESLDLPTGPTYGVMLNAKEVVATGAPAHVIDSIFDRSENSPIDLVRVAVNFAELEPLAAGVDRLHELGYRVGVNLMQIATRTPEEIAAFANHASDWGIEVAYFADSFGGMRPDDVGRVVELLARDFSGPIGCHMHNNMSLAFNNTVAAIEAGATYVDATVLGMGRGPGNAQTEYMAVELTQRGLAELDVAPLLPLVTQDFGALQRDYGWGANVFYFLSAAYNIHPTYIQEMTKDTRYTVDEIVAAVRQLKDAGGQSFSRARLESAVAESGLIDPDGTWDATGWCEGRPVLIVGPGPQGVSRRADVESYISAAHPVVIALNAIPPINPDLVDLYAVCHPVRAMIDRDILAAIDKPIALPRGIATSIGIDSDESRSLDYGIAASDGPMHIDARACTAPRITAFAYALAIASAGGATEIQLSGFDGFLPHDLRQSEMLGLITSYTEADGAVPLVAVTPTNYPLSLRSIYAPVGHASANY